VTGGSIAFLRINDTTELDSHFQTTEDVELGYHCESNSEKVNLGRYLVSYCLLLSANSG